MLENLIDVYHLTILQELVFSNLSLVFSDQSLQLGLPSTELIHDIAQVSICFIESSEFFVHKLGLVLKGQDLVLHWCNLFLQLLNLEI
jgi:hypothetical protein